MSIFYSFDADTIVIQGQTYPVRNEIKALGGKFCGVRKVWHFINSESQLRAVERLCHKSGGGILGGSVEVLKADLAQSGDRSRYLAQIELAQDSGGDDQAQAPVNEPESYSVSQLMRRAAGLISEGFPSSIWVVGEVQNLQDRPTGTYFDFAEADEKGSGQGAMTVRATLWSSQRRTIIWHHGLKKVSEVLQEGLKIRCLCKINLYQGRGQLSLNVINLDPEFTKGALALARENLLKELRASGIDQRNKQQSLRRLPFRIGLLSADKSRAKSDFLHQLFDGGFPGSVYFVPCRMQGEGVCVDVVAGMKILAEHSCDLIVITRGGGSTADLRWFDMPAVAYAIANVNVPVLAAIGHHDDTCVAEEICYTRQKTPTAAADHVNVMFRKVNEYLDQSAAFFHSKLGRCLLAVQDLQTRYRELLKAAADRNLSGSAQALERASHQLVQLGERRCRDGTDQLTRFAEELSSGCFKRLEAMLGHLEKDVEPKMSLALRDYFHSQTMKLEQVASSLSKRDPSPWLAEGWTRLERAGKKLMSTSGLDPGSQLEARLVDGVVYLEVLNVEHKSRPERDKKENQ